MLRPRMRQAPLGGGFCKSHLGFFVRNGDPLARQRRSSGQGFRRHPLGETWRTMLRRCYHERHHKHPLYGGRGIRVCDRWRNSFESFVSDMGPKPSPDHTLERIENDLGYSPDNCCWRPGPSKAARITAFGKTQIITDWAKETGITLLTISARLKRGWSPEDAVTRRAFPRAAA
jgi:hypothetical protein